MIWKQTVGARSTLNARSAAKAGGKKRGGGVVSAPGGHREKVHKQQGPRLPNAAAARDSPQQRRRLGNTASCDGAENADTAAKLLQFGVYSDGPELIECGVRPLPIVYQAIQPPTGTTTVSKPRPMSDNTGAFPDNW